MMMVITITSTNSWLQIWSDSWISFVQALVGIKPVRPTLQQIKVIEELEFWLGNFVCPEHWNLTPWKLGHCHWPCKSGRVAETTKCNVFPLPPALPIENQTMLCFQNACLPSIVNVLHISQIDAITNHVQISNRCAPWTCSRTVQIWRLFVSWNLAKLHGFVLDVCPEHVLIKGSCALLQVAWWLWAI